MAALGELVVSLSANTASFTESMDRAAYQTEQAMKKMRKDAEMVGVALGAMAAVGATALVYMVKSSIDAMDAMSKLAQQTGTTTESLTGLTYAAGMSGVSNEKLGTALVKLSKNMSDAANGTGEAKRGFDALGISVKNSDGTLKASDAVLSEVAGKLASYKDGAEKTALAVNIFGKAGAELIPLLNSGADGLKEAADEAQRMGLILDTETAKAAEQFNDNMSRLTLQQDAFANAIATAVLPVLNVLVEKFVGSAEGADKFSLAAEGTKVVLQTLIVTGSEVAFVFARIGNTLGGMAAQVSALGISFADVAGGPGTIAIALAKSAVTGEMSLKKFRDINDMIKADDAQARKDHDAFLNSILNPPAAKAAKDAAKPNAPGLPVTGPTAPKGAGKDPDADFQRYLKNLQNQISKTHELTAAEKLLSDIKNGALSVSPAQQAQLAAIAQEIDQTKEAIRISSERIALKRKDEQDSINAIRQIEAETAQQNKRNAANVEQIRIGLLSEADQEAFAHELRLEELRKFYEKKLELTEEYNGLIDAENKRHKRREKDTQDARDIESVALAGDTADQLYGLMQKAGKEQSALGKAMFVATKALAVAEIIMNTERAASAAMATTGVFGIPMATMIRINGYASAGIVAGLAVAEASAEGGYDIPAGTNPMTQLHEKEMVLPREHADVIRGLAANGGGGGNMKLTIVNNTSAPIGQVTEQRISPTERALIIQEAVGATAAQFADPNSKTSRALGRNYATQRSR